MSDISAMSIATSCSVSADVPGSVGVAIVDTFNTKYGALLLRITEIDQVLCDICAIVLDSDAGWSSLAARRAHNPKVTGSNPVPATKYKPKA